MSEPPDPLDDLLACGGLGVGLELRLERRVLYADLYDIDNDRDLAQVVMLLCGTALAADEHASGRVEQRGHRTAPLARGCRRARRRRQQPRRLIE